MYEIIYIFFNSTERVIDIIIVNLDEFTLFFHMYDDRKIGTNSSKLEFNCQILINNFCVHGNPIWQYNIHIPNSIAYPNYWVFICKIVYIMAKKRYLAYPCNTPQLMLYMYKSLIIKWIRFMFSLFRNRKSPMMQFSPSCLVFIGGR